MKPIYQSNGAVVAVVQQGNLYNIDGEFIGALHGVEVYDFLGHYLGYLSDDQRLLKSRRETEPRRIAPMTVWPERLQGIPTHFPLAPLFRQLDFSTLDVFEEHPERFMFISDRRPDLD